MILIDQKTSEIVLKVQHNGWMKQERKLVHVNKFDWAVR